MTWLGAPGDHLTLNFTNGLTRVWGSPEAEVYKSSRLEKKRDENIYERTIERVEDGSLAQ
jgi:hypothetical protein